MATGPVETWAQNLAEVGPIYPFVGSEVVLWVVGMAFWVFWHIWQARLESASYRDERQRYAGDLDRFRKAVRGETLL